VEGVEADILERLAVPDLVVDLEDSVAVDLVVEAAADLVVVDLVDLVVEVQAAAAQEVVGKFFNDSLIPFRFLLGLEFTQTRFYTL
jgi:hypothetical protein